ncbi:MAG: CAP domain-containing protein [Bacteroidetes bacterium]|nr:CAP domain-containing protein [Bacteroidota bacterium]
MDKLQMFHVKHFLFWLFLGIICANAYGQGNLMLEATPFAYSFKTDSSIWRALSEQKAFQSLTKEEKGFIYWVNVFRSNPKWFYEQPVTLFLKQFPQANTEEAKSLKDELLRASPIPVFVLDEKLMAPAKSQALDLSIMGELSHTSSSGKGFPERMKTVGYLSCAAENLYSGNQDPLEALILLLLDHGVPNLGHRRNLMNPSLQRMGLCFIKTQKGSWVLVQVMACL